MEQLKDFMWLFRMQPSEQQPNQIQLYQMRPKWGTSISRTASKAKLVNTSRLGLEGSIINPGLETTNGISTSNNQTLIGNMVIKASSINEASEIAITCPILFMGGSIEVRNIIPRQS